MYVRKRSRTGCGLFASRDIAAREFIVEYTGNRMPTTEADSLKTRYLFDLENGWTIDGSPMTNKARWINHSCDPNCECELEDNHIIIYAARDIKAGEELSFDYGQDYFDDFIAPVGCKCAGCVE